jgi:hypothetical protein
MRRTSIAFNMIQERYSQLNLAAESEEIEDERLVQQYEQVQS